MVDLSNISHFSSSSMSSLSLSYSATDLSTAAAAVAAGAILAFFCDLLIVDDPISSVTDNALTAMQRRQKQSLRFVPGALKSRRLLLLM